MSLLNEGLDAYLKAKFPSDAKKFRKLSKRINFLKRNSALKDPARLYEMAKERNLCAHEFGRYVDLKMLDSILDQIEAELAHLNVL